MAKQALGKGLGALISKRVATPAPLAEEGERIQSLPLGRISPSPLQPRVHFPADQLRELVESIRERGIIQPLIVREGAEGYELIAGERRWRAAKELGLKEAPVIVRKASDREVLELALIENLQREGLNPIEEASAYQRLHKEFRLTQDEISRQVGKSRASVANAMRLLDLTEEVQGLLKHGQLSVGHAKVLLSLKSADEQAWLASQIVRGALSVRVAEKMAATKLSRSSGKARPDSRRATARDAAPSIQRVQNLLTHHLATRVVVQHTPKKGTIQIDYYGNDDLSRLLELLGVQTD